MNGLISVRRIFEAVLVSLIVVAYILVVTRGQVVMTLAGHFEAPAAPAVVCPWTEQCHTKYSSGDEDRIGVEIAGQVWGLCFGGDLLVDEAGASGDLERVAGAQRDPLLVVDAIEAEADRRGLETGATSWEEGIRWIVARVASGERPPTT